MSEKFNLENRLKRMNLAEYKERAISYLEEGIQICRDTKGNHTTKEYLDRVLWFVENVETLNLEEFENCYRLLGGTLKENNLTHGNFLGARIARLRDYALILVETHEAIYKKL